MAEVKHLFFLHCFLLFYPSVRYFNVFQLVFISFFLLFVVVFPIKHLIIFRLFASVVSQLCVCVLSDLVRAMVYVRLKNCDDVGQVGWSLLWAV